MGAIYISYFVYWIEMGGLETTSKALGVRRHTMHFVKTGSRLWRSEKMEII